MAATRRLRASKCKFAITDAAAVIAKLRTSAPMRSASTRNEPVRSLHLLNSSPVTAATTAAAPNTSPSDAAAESMHVTELLPPLKSAPNSRAMLLILTNECMAAMRQAEARGWKAKMHVVNKNMTIVINRDGDQPALKFECSTRPINDNMEAICSETEGDGAYRTIGPIDSKINVLATERSFHEVRERTVKLMEEKNSRRAKDVFTATHAKAKPHSKPSAAKTLPLRSTSTSTASAAAVSTPQTPQVSSAVKNAIQAHKQRLAAASIEKMSDRQQERAAAAAAAVAAAPPAPTRRSAHMPVERLEPTRRAAATAAHTPPERADATATSRSSARTPPPPPPVETAAPPPSSPSETPPPPLSQPTTTRRIAHTPTKRHDSSITATRRPAAARSPDPNIKRRRIQTPPPVVTSTAVASSRVNEPLKRESQRDRQRTPRDKQQPVAQPTPPPLMSLRVADIYERSPVVAAAAPTPPPSTGKPPPPSTVVTAALEPTFTTAANVATAPHKTPPVKTLVDFERDYPPIHDTKQAISYHDTFEANYPTYCRCHERLSRVSNEFNDLKARYDRASSESSEQAEILRRIQRAYDRYKNDVNYAENRHRHAELHAKLAVLKRRLIEWEQQHAPLSPHAPPPTLLLNGLRPHHHQQQHRRAAGGAHDRRYGMGSGGGNNNVPRHSSVSPAGASTVNSASSTTSLESGESALRCFDDLMMA